MNLIQILLYLTLIVILIKLFDKLKNKRFYELLKQFHSYPTYPLIGNVHLLFGSYDGLLQRMENLLRPYDRMVYWMGPIPGLCLKKYEDIVTVLTHCQDREMFGCFDEWLGFGIFNAKYEEWKKSRKMFAPAFSSDMLSKYVQVFRRNASKMVEKLKSVADTDEEVDVLHYIMMPMSIDSIIENSVGIQIENSEKSGEEFCNAMPECIREIARRFLQPWLIFHYVYMIYLKITGKNKVIEQLQYLPGKLLRDNFEKAENIKRATEKGRNEEDLSKTIIKLLSEKGVEEFGFSETRLRDELLQMIFAAAETTPQAMSFLTLMLAINQDIQQKVYEEIVQFTEDGNYNLNDNLIYFDQCVKETLRMFSPGALITRRTNKEIILKDNTIIPANMTVILFLCFANWDADLYKNPLKWDPEHFSENAVKERPKNSQISFGYGPRSCIGAKYAMLSIKIQFIYILRHYHLSTNIKELTTENLKVDIGIKSKIGYPVKFTTRNAIKEK